MDFLITEYELKNKIHEIEQTFLNKNTAYFEVINYCRKVLEIYRKEIYLKDFPDTPSEIQFFREQKTIPLTYQIYYENLLSIELEISSIGESLRSKFIRKKIQKINSFLSAHKNFLQYIALDQEYLDEIYFTRKYFSKDHIANYNQYERDPLFSSSHDLLLSELNARNFLLEYLNKLSQDKQTSSIAFEEPVKINWTSSKVALTELIYALHLSGSVNNGNSTLKELMVIFETLTGLDLGDYPHTFSRLRGRSEPLKFIDKMRNSMLEYMEELDA
ncbi:RteC domain-containing protein [Christiangramia sediminis]|uniref:RteC domain-containing protein n=1 Tax=Christiangramia sediminis TaxID=2881336 RepID=A0A9X1RTY4_9FLAO|nr:RteC domain-containing protein [Christiangramia sediminis]MCB7480303.1 RteC domain-containing protein [Christiangramia sediminis]